MDPISFGGLRKIMDEVSDFRKRITSASTTDELATIESELNTYEDRGETYKQLSDEIDIRALIGPKRTQLKTQAELKQKQAQMDEAHDVIKATRSGRLRKRPHRLVEQ